MNWLLLIHQIPAKPAYFRAKIWRRLHQLGAVAIKQSVYALPDEEQSREDLTWLVKEITSGGGEAALVEARLLDGLNDSQIISMFQSAREEDYRKVIAESRDLGREWGGQTEDEQAESLIELRRRLEKLWRQFAEISRLDFFRTTAQSQTETALRELDTTLRLSAEPARQVNPSVQLPGLSGKTWVTRKNLYVDRLACAWLIKRFIDPEATWRFVDTRRHQSDESEIRFDMAEGEFTHEGSRCSFEVMINRLKLNEPGLAQVAGVIHDIDLKETAFALPETSGVQALFDGIVARVGDDLERINQAGALLDSLLAYFQQKNMNHDKEQL